MSSSPSNLVKLVEVEPTAEDLLTLANMDIDVEEVIGTKPPKPVPKRPKMEYKTPVNKMTGNLKNHNVKIENCKIGNKLIYQNCNIRENRISPQDNNITENQIKSFDFYEQRKDIDSLLEQSALKALGQRHSSSSCLIKLNGTYFEMKLSFQKKTDEEISSVNCQDNPQKVEPQTPIKTDDIEDCDEDIIEGTPQKDISLPWCGLNISSNSISPFRTELLNISKQNCIISSTGVSAVEKILTKKFCDQFGFTYTDSRTQIYSILVFKATAEIEGFYTFKFLLALASKAKIVTIDWIIESLKANYVLPVADFIYKSDKFVPRSSDDPACFPLSGVSLVIELLLDGEYPGPDAIKQLFHLTGAVVINKLTDISTLNSQFPKFIVFRDENQLTSQLLSKCSHYSTLAIGVSWVYDCLQQNRPLPIEKYLSMTFSLSTEVIKIYHIPSALLSSEEENRG